MPERAWGGDQPEAGAFRIPPERFDDHRAPAIAVAVGRGSRHRARSVTVRNRGRDDRHRLPGG